jgi:hypothetical protein
LTQKQSRELLKEKIVGVEQENENIIKKLNFQGGNMVKVLAWADVVKRHKVISGISTKGGLVRSLLCNSGSDQLYPNKIQENSITYYVGMDTQTFGIKALFKSLEERNNFPVFEKLAVNQWKELGNYSIESVKEAKKGFTSFTLIKL